MLVTSQCEKIRFRFYTQVWKTEIRISLRDYNNFYLFEDLVSFVKSIKHDYTRIQNTTDSAMIFKDRVRYQLYGR